MSHETQQDHISKKRVVYTMPGMNNVMVRRDEPYRVTDADALTMDLYYPAPAKEDTRTPAVVFVTGFSDVGARKMLGCAFKEMGSYISWARLVAASGLVAITYTNQEPADDADAVLQHMRQNAGALGLDENRIGVWSCSGNVPNALALLSHSSREYLTCAVLLYPYTLDLGGSSRVADASRQFGFVNAAAGQTTEALRRDVPLFIARAGQDLMPGLNEALDRFVAEAVLRNFPLTLVNHPTGPRAFDLFDDSARAREIVRQALAFLQFQLSP